MSDSDEQLIVAWRQSADRGPLEILAGRHLTTVRRMIHPMTPDDGLAEGCSRMLTLDDATMPIDTSYSGVQRPGKPRRVTGDRTRDVEWQIIQTVVPLDVTVRPLSEVS